MQSGEITVNKPESTCFHVFLKVTEHPAVLFPWLTNEMNRVGQAMFSTVGGGYLEYHGDVQYRGGYHGYRGGYLDYHVDLMIHVGDIMSTLGVFSTMGDLLLFEYPHGTEHPMVLMISPMCIMISPPPRYSNYKGWYPITVLNTPKVLMISPTVLNTPTNTQDIPTFIISPHGTEHPPRYSRYDDHAS